MISLYGETKKMSEKNVFAVRIKSLQKLMRARNLRAFIVPSNDIHSNEYLPKCFKDRAFMSGFSGSSGTLVVCENSAHLFTDGRYKIQAKNELKGSKIALEKDADFVAFLQTMLQNGALKKGDCVGVNPKAISINAHSALKKALKGVKIALIDLVSEIWNRPPLPKEPIFAHKKRFVGESTDKKLQAIRTKMAEIGVEWHFISALDDIAWITNLRGSDVAHNPVFMAFLLISQSDSTLFVRHKIDKKSSQNLAKFGIKIAKYESVESHLREIKGEKILLDAQKTSIYIAKILKKGGNKIIRATNPSTLLKVRKNARELGHIKDAMIADGVALCEFFAWFEARLDSTNRSAKSANQRRDSSNDFTKSANLNEIDIDTQITAFRAKNRSFICNSFATIAGFNANGALPHYRASAGHFSEIKGDGLLLIDSGAQYQNGTTDITRVVGVGRVSEAQKRDYTRVLKALIALSTAIFPKNLALPLLDSLARADLWREGIEYMHGTGHGVGYFLNVHESPISISRFAPQNAENSAREGVITSIEPGIYREGKWGIRLENLVAISKAKTAEVDFGEFLCFETLTLCPFEADLIDFALLNSAEKAWLEAYHKKVFKALAPHLKGNALAWLKRKCASVFLR